MSAFGWFLAGWCTCTAFFTAVLARWPNILRSERAREAQSGKPDVRARGEA